MRRFPPLRVAIAGLHRLWVGLRRALGFPTRPGNTHPSDTPASSVFAAFGRGRPAMLFWPRPLDPATPRPLLLMLHGCKQDPADFARGTRMNEAAEKRGMAVLYPGQWVRANGLRCWNWFDPRHQRRGEGEPASLVALIDDLAQTHPIDRSRIYVAGLSAGGAMAAVLAREYPDVFAAVGVHSGLPAGSAHDVASAFSVMRHGRVSPRTVAATAPAELTNGQPVVPLMVLQGDADDTVHPTNAQALIRALMGSLVTEPESHRFEAEDQGRRYTRTRWHAADGQALAELWELHGLGHAWSGGNPDGSYADGLGPKASDALLGFFAQHHHPTAGKRQAAQAVTLPAPLVLG